MTRPCFPCLCLPHIPTIRFISAPQNTHAISRPTPVPKPNHAKLEPDSACQPHRNLCAKEKSGEPEVTKSPCTVAISVTGSPDSKLPSRAHPFSCRPNPHPEPSYSPASPTPFPRDRVSLPYLSTQTQERFNLGLVNSHSDFPSRTIGYLDHPAAVPWALPCVLR